MTGFDAGGNLQLQKIVVTYLIFFALIRVANDFSALLTGPGASLVFLYIIPAGLAFLWRVSQAKDKRTVD